MEQVIVKVKLKGLSPISFSKYHQTPKKERETHEDYEKRTWRERAHMDEKGNIMIPPMMFKNCLSNAAKYLSMQISGQGKKTYTKKFESGIIVSEPMILPVKKEEAEELWILCSADGKRGGKTKVPKCFPTISTWEGEVTFIILDKIITEDVFRTHLEEAGIFIGLGSFRPENNGYHGRFEVVGLKWKE